MSATVDVLVTQFLEHGGQALNSRFRSLSVSAGQFEGATARAMTRTATVGSVGVAGLIATSKLVSSALEKAGEAQATKSGFTSLLGDANKANNLFKQLETLALESPFDDAETKRVGQFMLATGTQADELVDKMKAIGNAVSAAGKGQNEFNGVVMAMSALNNSTVASRAQIKRLELRGVQANKILQEELGLTADQVANLGKENLKGSVVAEALYRGMAKVAGGKAMENMVKTLPGQVAMLEDAKNQLLTAIGEPLLNDATKFVGFLAKGATHMRDMARASPGITKGLVYGAGIASGTAAIYGGIQAFRMAAMAKKALEKATRADDVAEKAKTLTAGREALSLTKTAVAADKATTAKKGLEVATRSLGARAAAFLGKDALTIKDTSLLGRMGAQAGARSVGQVGLGAAAGAAAGYGVYDTYSNKTNQAALRSMGINVSENGAKMGGAAVAGIVGALAIAAPQFAIPFLAAVAAVKLTEYGANKLINEPMEKKAAAGTGVDNAEMYGKGMDARLAKADKELNYGELTKIYQHMADKSAIAGDNVQSQRYQFQSDMYKKKYQAELITGPDTFSQAYRDKIAAERSTPEYQANVRKQFQKGDEQAAAINASIGWGPEGPSQREILALQQQSGQMPQGRTVQGEGRYKDGGFEITFGKVRIEDPSGQQARRQADNAVRRMYR
ncbi:hypothetical protein EON83_17230 [bacterium]|nr:MAG: hypothetical protein EON83_17230 [bacterium]